MAIYLADNDIIPPSQWYHNPNIKNKYYKTVAYKLESNNLPIPNEWYDESMKDKQKNPDFINQAIYGEIPKKPDNIDPNY